MGRNRGRGRADVSCSIGSTQLCRGWASWAVGCGLSAVCRLARHWAQADGDRTRTGARGGFVGFVRIAGGGVFGFRYVRQGAQQDVGRGGDLLRGPSRPPRTPAQCYPSTIRLARCRTPNREIIRPAPGAAVKPEARAACDTGLRAALLAPRRPEWRWVLSSEFAISGPLQMQRTPLVWDRLLLGVPPPPSPSVIGAACGGDLAPRSGRRSVHPQYFHRAGARGSC
jgi:hypothetical protein